MGICYGSGARVAEMSLPVPHLNVVDEYVRAATPGVGSLSVDSGVSETRSRDEIEFARWLLETFGGEIEVLEESGQPNVKNPDYLWNGKLWDLKTTSTAASANGALQSGIRQIRSNPGGVMLNYGDHDVSMPAVKSEIEKRLRYVRNITFDVMIVQRGRVLAIFRYKK